MTHSTEGKELPHFNLDEFIHFRQQQKKLIEEIETLTTDKLAAAVQTFFGTLSELLFQLEGECTVWFGAHQDQDGITIVFFPTLPLGRPLNSRELEQLTAIHNIFIIEVAAVSRQPKLKLKFLVSKPGAEPDNLRESVRKIITSNGLTPLGSFEEEK